MEWHKIIKEIIFLLGISVISAFTVNFFSPHGIAFVGHRGESPGAVTAGAKSGVFNGELEIKNVKIAKEIYDSVKAIFVDTRSLENYKDGHIKRAESLPIDQFDNFIGKFKNKYPVDTFIITYCSGRTCDDGYRLEQLLFDNGYVNVSVFIDGYTAWKAEGYPIE